MAQAAVPRPGLLEIMYKAAVLNVACFMLHVSCILHMRWQEQELKKKELAVEACFHFPGVIMVPFVT